jgi:hypothetical protein
MTAAMSDRSHAVFFGVLGVVAGTRDVVGPQWFDVRLTAACVAAPTDESLPIVTQLAFRAGRAVERGDIAAVHRMLSLALLALAQPHDTTLLRWIETDADVTVFPPQQGAVVSAEDAALAERLWSATVVAAPMGEHPGWPAGARCVLMNMCAEAKVLAVRLRCAGPDADRARADALAGFLECLPTSEPARAAGIILHTAAERRRRTERRLRRRRRSVTAHRPGPVVVGPQAALGPGLWAMTSEGIATPWPRWRRGHGQMVRASGLARATRVRRPSRPSRVRRRHPAARHRLSAARSPGGAPHGDEPPPPCSRRARARVDGSASSSAASHRLSLCDARLSSRARSPRPCRPLRRRAGVVLAGAVPATTKRSVGRVLAALRVTSRRRIRNASVTR